MKRRTGLRLVALTPLLAVMLCAWALREVRINRSVDFGEKAAARLPALAAPARMTTNAVSTQPIVAAALFQSTRIPPVQRYQIPGNSNAAPAVPMYAPPTAPMQQFMLLGSAIFGDRRDIVAISTPGGEPRILHVGETFQGFRISRITRDSVILTGSDTTLILRKVGGSGGNP